MQPTSQTTEIKVTVKQQMREGAAYLHRGNNVVVLLSSFEHLPPGVERDCTLKRVTPMGHFLRHGFGFQEIPAQHTHQTKQFKKM
jgi:hypothetical protein